MTTTDKVYTPLPPPDDLYSKDPLPPLTERERKSYNEVYQHFAKAGYRLSGVTNGELSEDEKFWLSYECILRSVVPSWRYGCSDTCELIINRFLRGTKWKVPDTIQRLENTLKWRRDFGLYTSLNAAHVEPEVRSSLP